MYGMILRSLTRNISSPAEQRPTTTTTTPRRVCSTERRTACGSLVASTGYDDAGRRYGAADRQTVNDHCNSTHARCDSTRTQSTHDAGCPFVRTVRENYTVLITTNHSSDPGRATESVRVFVCLFVCVTSGRYI